MSTAKRVQGSRTGRPIMLLLDLLSRRWALRIIWELRAGPLTFRALRAASDDLSPTVLQTRLDELRQARLVGLSEGGYELTGLGRELFDTFLPLNDFAKRWAPGAQRKRSDRGPTLDPSTSAVGRKRSPDPLPDSRHPGSRGAEKS